jgi:signal transduction histidine kinase
LANLLDNAMRHARKQVTATVGWSEGKVAYVAVRDDGPGPEPRVRAAMFERFVSADGRGGHGLGLSIVRAVARAHGGDAEFKDGEFRMTLRECP